VASLPRAKTKLTNGVPNALRSKSGPPRTPLQPPTCRFIAYQDDLEAFRSSVANYGRYSAPAVRSKPSEPQVATNTAGSLPTNPRIPNGAATFRGSSCRPQVARAQHRPELRGRRCPRGHCHFGDSDSHSWPGHRTVRTIVIGNGRVELSLAA